MQSLRDITLTKKAYRALKTLRAIRRSDAIMYRAIGKAAPKSSLVDAPESAEKAAAFSAAMENASVYVDAAFRLGIPCEGEWQRQVLVALRAQIPFFGVYSKFSKLS